LNSPHSGGSSARTALPFIRRGERELSRGKVSLGQVGFGQVGYGSVRYGNFFLVLNGARETYYGKARQGKVW